MVSSQNIEEGIIKVYNKYGALVQVENASDNNQFNIDLEKLNGGVYFVKIFSRNDIIETHQVVLIK